MFLFLGFIRPVALNILRNTDSFKKLLNLWLLPPQEKNKYAHKLCVSFPIFNDSQQHSQKLFVEQINEETGSERQRCDLSKVS